MRDHYFDLDDYETPIKAYFNDKYEYYGDSNMTKEVSFYIQQNEAILNDNYLSINGQEEVEKFISIGDYHTSTITRNPAHVFKMSLSKSDHYFSYERNVYTILDFLGDLGGIYEIFMTLGYMFVTLFTSTAFYYSILPKIYQVDTIGCQIDHVSS